MALPENVAGNVEVVMVPGKKAVAALGATQGPGILETKEILSIAAGGCVPAELSFLHSKTSLKVVPAYDSGIVMLAVVHVACPL